MRTAGSDCKQIAGSDSGVSWQRCGHQMHYNTFMQCVEVHCLAGISAQTPETWHIYLWGGAKQPDSCNTPSLTTRISGGSMFTAVCWKKKCFLVRQCYVLCSIFV